MLYFLRRRCSMTVQGQRRNRLQNAEKKSWGIALKMPLYWLFTWGVWEGQKVVCVPTHTICAADQPSVFFIATCT
ncbi:hypothetical protein I79_004566 [Cricetulus griseus]|uniref:Uncharacterized protein n=1 Tax=Cricetulus griseus TaxID=10029 RepID=G3H2W3_CRIGR|nr:hypothetical protein I79_004566 [Cricetulus griseus]